MDSRLSLVTIFYKYMNKHITLLCTQINTCDNCKHKQSWENMYTNRKLTNPTEIKPIRTLYRLEFSRHRVSCWTDIHFIVRCTFITSSAWNHGNITLTICRSILPQVALLQAMLWKFSLVKELHIFLPEFLFQLHIVTVMEDEMFLVMRHTLNTKHACLVKC